MSKLFDLMSVFNTEELSKDETFFLDEVSKTTSECFKGPQNLVQSLGELGLFQDSVSPLCYGLALQRVESVDSGLRSLISVHSSLGLYALKRYGKHLLTDDYLNGSKSLAFALTEKDHGSNPAKTKTIFKLSSDKKTYEVSGEKAWVTNAKNSDALIIWGSLDGETVGALVPTDTKGLEILDMPKTYSLELSKAYSLKLTKCLIPKENLLNIKGIKGPLSCLNNARLGVAWGVMGLSWSAFLETLEYTKKRILFDEPLAAKQITQYKLSEIYAKIIETQFFLKEITKLKTAEKSVPPHLVSIAKMRSCEKAFEILKECRDLLGGIGVTEDFSIARHMRNLESVRTYEGTDTIHRLILGGYITKEKKF